MIDQTNQATAEVLEPAILADFEMHHQNQARDHFEALERILKTFVIPAIGSDHPMSRELRARMENVKMCSQQFCWRHRHLGYSYSSKEVGA